MPKTTAPKKKSKFIDDGAEESGEDLGPDPDEQSEDDGAQLSGDFIASDGESDDEHSQYSQEQRRKRSRTEKTSTKCLGTSGAEEDSEEEDVRVLKKAPRPLLEESDDEMYSTPASSSSQFAQMSSSRAMEVQMSEQGMVALRNLVKALISFTGQVLEYRRIGASVQKDFETAAKWLCSEILEKSVNEWESRFSNAFLTHYVLSSGGDEEIGDALYEHPVCPLCHENFRPTSRVTFVLFHGLRFNIEEFLSTAPLTVAEWIATTYTHNRIRPKKSKTIAKKSSVFAIHTSNCLKTIDVAQKRLMTLFALPSVVADRMKSQTERTQSFNPRTMAEEIVSKYQREF